MQVVYAFDYLTEANTVSVPGTFSPAKSESVSTANSSRSTFDDKSSTNNEQSLATPKNQHELGKVDPR